MSTTGIEFVTGGLGDGKSLYCVSRIKDALAAGRRVATNYNLNLEAVCRAENKWARVVRVPDAPSVSDLRALGLGSTEPKKKGLLVLDELGTWFNARDFANKGRAEVIKYCIHLRKKRWDVLFIVQDFTMVDKQIRGGMTTFLTSCRSSHKGWWFFRMLPEFFWASVRNKERILVRNSFIFPGELAKLGPFYDTEQLFDVKLPETAEEIAEAEYTDPDLLERERHYAALNGFYSVLPPAYTLRPGEKPARPAFKLSFQTVAFPLLFIAALIGVGVAMGALTNQVTEPFDAAANVAAENGSDAVEGSELTSDTAEVVTPVDTFEVQYGALLIVGYTRFGDAVRYTFMDQRSGAVRHQADIEAAGVVVKPRSRDEALLVGPDYRFVAVTR